MESDKGAAASPRGCTHVACRGGHDTLRAAGARARLPTWRTGKAPAHQEPETPARRAPAWRAARELQRAHEAARTSCAGGVTVHYRPWPVEPGCRLEEQDRFQCIRVLDVSLGSSTLGSYRALRRAHEAALTSRAEEVMVQYGQWPLGPVVDVSDPPTVAPVWSA